MPQVESLTVQILGDSSGLRQDLNSVADLLDQLQQQLSSSAEGAGQFGNALGGFAQAIGPLQKLGSEMSLLSQRMLQISSQPVSLNVQPALDALSRLMQAAQAAAAQLAALSSASIAGPAIRGPAGGIPQIPMEGGSLLPRAYAGGGLVTGPTGIDQVPARLTAGEFVLNPEAVSALGLMQLDRWNRGIDLTPPASPEVLQRPVSGPSIAPAGMEQRVVRAASISSSALPSQQTQNHFGGIEIHVRSGVDASEVLQDLRRQGIGSRHRWG